MELFPNVFGRISMITDAIVSLDINPNVVPVVQPPNKVPEAMIEPLKTELNRMEQLGLIQKLDINEATDWCLNLVLVHKPNGQLCVCLDPIVFFANSFAATTSTNTRNATFKSVHSALLQ